ncbi:MAG TPA: sulfur oxidation c-type cytochrome SoxA [Burkholderiaceae bacterium]|nr:sulfur oxidation c-type cytochrome SoxA [Burkholderiaceae bacterium]
MNRGHGQAARYGRIAAAALLLCAGAAAAQNNTLQEIERYRQMLQDGNPAELLVARGEELWKEKRGPKKASLEQCDLGLGPGVVKGAYAQLPRHFQDTNSVLDFEGRLVHCMTTLQGFDRAELVKAPFSGAGQRQTDIESLTAYVVEASRGMPIKVPQGHPMEKAAFDRGKYLFYMRGGPYDFACSTCHGVDGQRIRLQDLPNFEKAEPAQRAFATWPAYRLSQGTLRTMQWRINDCFRQQRFPEPVFVSQATIDLITFLGVKAEGGKMDSPSIKR